MENVAAGLKITPRILRRATPDLFHPFLIWMSGYARHGYAVKAECRECGHSAKLDARALSGDAIKRNLSRDVEAIERRLKCQQCGKIRSAVTTAE